MFSIHSVTSDRELIFSSHKGEYFFVELKDAALSVSTDVWATTDADGLNNFFRELAGFRNRWQGTRSWGSLDWEFKISAICTTLGHVIFQVEISGNLGGPEEWKVQAGLETELGQLDYIAQRANAFFQKTNA